MVARKIRPALTRRALGLGALGLGCGLALGVRPARAQHEAPELAITAPVQDQVLRHPLGSLAIAVAMRELDDGEQVVLLLDGEEVARHDERPQFIVLETVTPGTHRLQLRIVDEDDEVVAQSEVATFHMLRRSRLNRPR